MTEITMGPAVGHLARFLIAGLMVAMQNQSVSGAVYDTHRLWEQTKDAESVEEIG